MVPPASRVMSVGLSSPRLPWVGESRKNLGGMLSPNISLTLRSGFLGALWAMRPDWVIISISRHWVSASLIIFLTVCGRIICHLRRLFPATWRGKPPRRMISEWIWDSSTIVWPWAEIIISVKQPTWSWMARPYRMCSVLPRRKVIMRICLPMVMSCLWNGKMDLI